MLSTQLWSRPSQKGFNCQEQKLGLCERLALWRASRGATGAAAWSCLTRRKVSLPGWEQPCSSVLSRLDLPLWNLLIFFIRVKYGSSVTFSCSNQRQRPGRPFNLFKLIHTDIGIHFIHFLVCRHGLFSLFYFKNCCHEELHKCLLLCMGSHSQIY